MPKLPTYLLHWLEEDQVYELARHGQAEHRFGREGGPAWVHFLETHTSFAFQGSAGRLSIVKETRPRGTGYWYAYRTSGQRTVKRYLGSASQVTIARLEEVADALNHHRESGAQATRKHGETEASSSHPTALLLSKLQAPRLPSSLVARSHLLERLDAVLEHKLTLLVAPAGYGKTTIVNQWIHERPANAGSRSVAWVSLDRHDNDVFRFWRTIITACQAFPSRPGQAAFASLARSFQPPFTPPSLEMALTLLLNDLTQLTPHGLLILDDYHLIEEPRIHELLTFFLDSLPATFSVLMLTRAEPLQLPLLRLRASGELCELHAADLRFSLEETARFVRQSFPIPLSEAAVAQLDESLQGWVAGLRLLTLTLPLSAGRAGGEQLTARAVEHALVSLEQRTSPSSPYRPLLEYLVTEILRAQPEPVLRFLLHISMLPRLSGALCEAVTGFENGAAQLEAIEQAGLFLEALDGTWYRFHALFSEAMRREATLRLGEEALRALSVRASHWYEQHALLSEAIEAALMGDDGERAAQLIEQMGVQRQSAELSAMGRWLERLPEEVLRAHPLLCWLGALSLQVLQEQTPSTTPVRERADALLRMAEEGWRRQGALSLLGLIPALHAMRAWKAGQFSRALEDARQALAQLALHNRQDNAVLLFRAICLFIVATGSMYEGHFEEARSYLLEAHACSQTAGDGHMTRSMLLLAGVCSSALGELHQAHAHYQLVLSAAREQEDREIIAQAFLGLATISFAWNKLSEAEQQVREALTFAREEDADQINNAAFQLALLAYARGQITSAQQQLAALLARLQVTATPQTAQLLPTVLAWQARLLLETGELELALRLLEMPELEEQTTARIVQARLKLAQGLPQEARHRLERLLSDALEHQQMHEVLELRVLLALAYVACQEGHKARQSLQQALAQARRESFVQPFLSEGEPLLRLLRQTVPMLEERALRSYAQSLLRAFARLTDADVSAAAGSQSQQFEPLSAQEQRVLRLLVAGYSNQEIAQELVVSVNTVKDHAKHLYRKLGVSNRLQASTVAHQLNLV